MPTPEMLEKARAAFKWLCEQPGPITVADIPDLLVRHAQSAVRDAVRELEPYIQHRRSCERRSGLGKCACGLSALRQKFGVSE